MEYSFDPGKDKELRARRGVGFDQVVGIFHGPHVVSIKNDDPEQYRAIGFHNETLWTIIFEDVEDSLGELRWLITFWPSTKAERAFYDQQTK